MTFNISRLPRPTYAKPKREWSLFLVLPIQNFLAALTESDVDHAILVERQDIESPFVAHVVQRFTKFFGFRDERVKVIIHHIIRPQNLVQRSSKLSPTFPLELNKELRLSFVEDITFTASNNAI